MTSSSLPTHSLTLTCYLEGEAPGLSSDGNHGHKDEGQGVVVVFFDPLTLKVNHYPRNGQRQGIPRKRGDLFRSC